VAGRSSKKDKRPSRSANGARRKPYPVWVVTLAAFLLPGSGQMLNGFPFRGITMQFFMLFLGYVTYQVTDDDISIIGRFSGGLFVYVFSVIDAHGMARRRMAAWERGDGPAGKPAQAGPKSGETARASERRGQGARKASGAQTGKRPARRPAKPKAAGQAPSAGGDAGGGSEPDDQEPPIEQELVEEEMPPAIEERPRDPGHADAGGDDANAPDAAGGSRPGAAR
jgi:hypothetical protein